jgi:hypothetical protein
MENSDIQRLVPLVNSKMIGDVDDMQRERNGNHASAIFTGCKVCFINFAIDEFKRPIFMEASDLDSFHHFDDIDCLWLREKN